MKRREFVRIVGGVGLTSKVSPGYLFATPEPNGDLSGVLVEAASFGERGGWKLDTQHYQQMGGCYLLAHGMGRPVPNAEKTIRIPQSGRWHVWVRTRDWCPGPWQAPGRFKVHVNGKPLPVEFGTEPGWAWQRGGAVELSAGEVGVELEDLTGFDGRCDAIYLSQEPAPELPNSNMVELAAWKDRFAGRASLDIEETSYDLVIVGGGIAGCAAALAARSQGLSVALIQDRPVFGGNASEEIRVHTEGIHGMGGAILEQIDTKHYPNGSVEAVDDQHKREGVMATSGADLFPLHLCCGLERRGNRIASVEALQATTGIIRRFHAPVFVDATGDGWLGYWAGADCRYGRESSAEFGEAWDEHGELWSPKEPDNRVMGSSVLWNSRVTHRRLEFPDVPWAMPVARNHSAVAGEWDWEYSSNGLNQVDDAEWIRDHMLRAIYGSFANAKKRPEHATFELQWVAFNLGKRESRRLMGDYIYTMRDADERREFPDTVVEETRAIDVHYQRAVIGQELDFLSTALFREVGKYYLPFRCLYSRNVTNLMMGGRCFSCSHVGLGGPRVMNTCGQMGIAVGYAAVLCRKYRATPRQVGKQHINELRRLIGYE
jgi:hypothetical protein